MPRQEEPELVASHQDFMLCEMQDMAIDFSEEGRVKRLLSLKIAKEAQRELYRRVSEKQAIEMKRKEEEEQKKRREAVSQIDDIMHDNNNNTLQKMVSLSGMFNEPLTGQGDGGMGQFFNDEVNNDPFFN